MGKGKHHFIGLLSSMQVQIISASRRGGKKYTADLVWYVCVCVDQCCVFTEITLIELEWEFWEMNQSEGAQTPGPCQSIWWRG